MGVRLGKSFFVAIAAGVMLAACRPAPAGRTAVSPSLGQTAAAADRGWLRSRISATAVNGRFDSCLFYSRRMLLAAQQDASRADEIFASIQIGQSSFFLNRYDTASYYLNRALLLSQRENDAWGMGAAYNGLGLVAVCAHMNYYGALDCFTASVQALEDSSDRVLYHVAMANLALTYWHRSDPAGLPYARKVLEYGREQRDTMQIFYGTYACAAMYYLLDDIPRALAHVRETVSLVDRYYDKTGVYTLSANILRAAGDSRKAAMHYRMAASYLEGAEATSVLDYWLGYGQFLLEQKRYGEAAAVLRSGIAAAERSGNTVSRHHFYRNLSVVYRKLGLFREALDSFEQFHTVSDSIFNVDRERALKEMQVKYETAKREKEYREKEYEVLRERRRVQLAGLIIAAIAAVLGVVWVLYRRKNALYLQIVRQYRDAIQREKSLAARIGSATAEGARAQTEKYAVSSLSDEKGRTLFDRIERLMQQQKVYRQYDLTKERLAEMVGCNRTYLSQVVNEQTGMNLVSYINSLRVNEAVELLSDAANRSPLKAIALEVGFSSLSTFYKLFKQTVGMTPLKFREKVVELARNRSKGRF